MPNAPTWQRSLDIALAAGNVFRTKADGWKLFCERLNVPPFLVWNVVPGLDRLTRALAVTDNAAFVAEGFLRWLNRIRPAGAPELTEISLNRAGGDWVPQRPGPTPRAGVTAAPGPASLRAVFRPQC